MSIPAALFKAECLKLMDRVAKTGQPVVITKHGRPVAQLAPIAPGPQSLFGYMKDTVRIEGDVMAPANVEWSALSGDEDGLYVSPLAKRRSRRQSGKSTRASGK